MAKQLTLEQGEIEYILRMYDSSRVVLVNSIEDWQRDNIDATELHVELANVITTMSKLNELLPVSRRLTKFLEHRTNGEVPF